MVRRAVESVCRQSLAALEILVVDDASDPPLEHSDLPTDTRLRMLRNPERQTSSVPPWSIFSKSTNMITVAIGKPTPISLAGSA